MQVLHGDEARAIRFAEVDAAETAYLQRLARELTRFLTASGRAVGIGSLWITGGASVRADAKDMLREVFGVEPRELELLSHLEHDLSPDEAADLEPRPA